MAVNLYQEYRVKFYLNARHYIIIDEKKGEVHPHTWEFALYMKIGRGSFVQFHTLEQGITDYLASFQNKVLNEVEPFDAITPTLEHMADYFANTFYQIIHDIGGILVRVEASETPTRSYIVDLEEKNKNSQLAAESEDLILSDVIDVVLDEILR
jgi:6-pyruvoyltetrahydropterin/6-carboxytetrahydropterin synthase